MAHLGLSQCSHAFSWVLQYLKHCIISVLLEVMHYGDEAITRALAVLVLVLECIQYAQWCNYRIYSRATLLRLSSGWKNESLQFGSLSLCVLWFVWQWRQMSQRSWLFKSPSLKCSPVCCTLVHLGKWTFYLLCFCLIQDSSKSKKRQYLVQLDLALTHWRTKMGFKSKEVR